MAVRKASAKKAFINNVPELANDPSLTQALGLLLYAHENCEEQIEEVVEVDNPIDAPTETPKTPRKNEKKRKEAKKAGRGIMDMVGGLFGSIGNMFEEEDDDDN